MLLFVTPILITSGMIYFNHFSKLFLQSKPPNGNWSNGNSSNGNWSNGIWSNGNWWSKNQYSLNHMKIGIRR
jgi:hypothetical protein